MRKMPYSEFDRAAPVIRLACVPSTNLEVKQRAQAGAPDGLAVIAARQTVGRGRLGRGFESPEGGVYISMLRYPRAAADKLASLTPCVAVAVRRAIARVCGVRADIKWPNDLLYNGRKLCGILVESSSAADGRRFIVIGVGINVNTDSSALSDAVRGTAMSLKAALGRVVDEAAVSRAVIEELDRVYAAWECNNAAFLDEYRRACISLDCPVTIIRDGAACPAYAVDIDESYALIVIADGQRQRVTMGEVSLRKNLELEDKI